MATTKTLAASISTNAAQIQARADAIAATDAERAIDKALESNETKAFRAAAHDAVVTNTGAIRSELRQEHDEDVCVILANADKAQDFRHGAWGIPADLTDNDARAMWICKLAGIAMPTKRRVHVSEVVEGKATQDDFDAAQLYRSVMNRFQAARDRGRIALGLDATRKAKQRAIGRKKGRGNGKVEVVSAETVARYFAAIVEFGKANGRKVVGELAEPFTAWLLAPETAATLGLDAPTTPEPVADAMVAMVDAAPGTITPAETLAMVDAAVKVVKARKARAPKVVLAA